MVLIDDYLPMVVIGGYLPMVVTCLCWSLVAMVVIGELWQPFMANYNGLRIQN